MKDVEVLVTFADAFRDALLSRLQAGIGVRCTIYRVVGPGAVLEFELGYAVENVNNIAAGRFDTVNKAMMQVRQGLFRGDLEGFVFSGLTTVMEPNRIIIINGEEDAARWTTNVATSEALRVLGSAVRPASPAKVVTHGRG